MKNISVSWILCVIAACSIRASILPPSPGSGPSSLPSPSGPGSGPSGPGSGPTDLLSLVNGGLPPQIINYIFGDVKDISDQLLNPPQNNNDSLGYRVFTKRNPEKPCFLVLTQESLEECQIDSKDKLVLFAPGFQEYLRPGNLFEVIKDKILANGPFTVIILDWTKYIQPPIAYVVKNMLTVGSLVADVLKFIIKYAEVKAEDMILTGHSLGATLVGQIAKNVPNIGRIDSLDPNFLFLDNFPYAKTDAKFVRAMHTSIVFGTSKAVADVDFFVNDGSLQPQCTFGSRYPSISGNFITIDNLYQKYICSHAAIMTYYLYSINSTDCQFLGTLCDSYDDFQAGKCPPNDSRVANMGFYGEDVSGLPEKSKFYLKTSSTPPYCVKTGAKR